LVDIGSIRQTAGPRSAGDLLKVETGSLYPALPRLEKRGWLKSEWDVSEANPRAKSYRLTPVGKAQLSRERDRWSQMVNSLALAEGGAFGADGRSLCSPAGRARSRSHGLQHHLAPHPA